MKNLQKRIKNHDWNMGISILLNLIMLIIYLRYFNCYFESNDDNAMATITEGIYGCRSSRMVYINILIGKALSFFSAWIPTIKWYLVLFYALMFVSYCVICYMLLSVQGRRTGLISCTFVLIVIGYQTYVVFQFTRVAAIVSIAGGLLVFFALDNKSKKRILPMVIGSFLLLCASMIRFEMFGVALLSLCGLGFYKMQKAIREKDKQNVKKLFSYLVLFVAITSVALGLRTFDKYMYEISPEWNEYCEYNTLRSNLWDYGFPEYKENQELYEELGITENDLTYYKTWNMDFDIFTVDNMKKLVSAKEEQKINIDTVKLFAKTFLSYNFLIPILAYLIVLSGLLFLQKERRGLLSIMYLIWLLVDVFLFVRGRYGKPRVDISVYICIIMILLYNIESVQAIKYKYVVISIITIVAFNMQTFMQRIVYTPLDKSGAQEMYDLVSGDERNFYFSIIGGAPYSTIDSYDFAQPANMGDAKNIFYSGGWTSKMPLTEAILDKYGISNPYKDCLNNKNAYVIDEMDSERTLKYIQRHYNENAKRYLVKQVGNCGFFKFTTDKIDIDTSKCIENSDDLSGQVGMTYKNGTLDVYGNIYKAGTNSFEQNVYVEVNNRTKNKVSYKFITQKEMVGYTDVDNGKYSAVIGQYKLSPKSEYEINLILDCEGDMYRINCGSISK